MELTSHAIVVWIELSALTFKYLSVRLMATTYAKHTRDHTTMVLTIYIIIYYWAMILVEWGTLHSSDRFRNIILPCGIFWTNNSLDLKPRECLPLLARLIDTKMNKSSSFWLPKVHNARSDRQVSPRMCVQSQVSLILINCSGSDHKNHSAAAQFKNPLSFIEKNSWNFYETINEISWYEAWRERRAEAYTLEVVQKFSKNGQ